MHTFIYIRGEDILNFYISISKYIQSYTCQIYLLAFVYVSSIEYYSQV